MNDFDVGNKLVKDKHIKEMTVKQLTILKDRLSEEIHERFKDEYCISELYANEYYTCRSLFFGKGKRRNKAWLEENKWYKEKI
tara:strand:- start:1068 stop:1316 length:249 start_codon:yes stop_codon:yes gene_type:complete